MTYLVDNRRAGAPPAMRASAKVTVKKYAVICGPQDLLPGFSDEFRALGFEPSVFATDGFFALPDLEAAMDRAHYCLCCVGVDRPREVIMLKTQARRAESAKFGLVALSKDADYVRDILGKGKPLFVASLEHGNSPYSLGEVPHVLTEQEPAKIVSAFVGKHG